MRALRTRLGLLLATVAILAVSAPAQAEYLVPPGNSAATQYTETYPTAGGNKDPEKATGERAPKEVLGSRNARRLEAQGEEGRAVAEVAAETAPDTEPAATGGEGRGDENDKGESRNEDSDAPSPGGAGGSGGSSDSEGPSGSSGLGEVLAQATGSSASGGTGLLLPLLIVGGIAWAIAYLLRLRRRPAA